MGIVRPKWYITDHLKWWKSQRQVLDYNKFFVFYSMKNVKKIVLLKFDCFNPMPHLNLYMYTPVYNGYKEGECSNGGSNGSHNRTSGRDTIGGGGHHFAEETTEIKQKKLQSRQQNG